MQEGTNRIALHPKATLWLALSIAPLFLALPRILRQSIGSWLALGASHLLTILLYSITLWLLARSGIDI